MSGGAFGIDAAGHRGALDAGAETYAVLGCGVDVVYPDRHAALFARIAGAGRAHLTSLPPGTPPQAQQFPQRNAHRRRAGRRVIVVEAALQSGALITAKVARKRGSACWRCRALRHRRAAPRRQGTPPDLGSASRTRWPGRNPHARRTSSAAFAPLMSRVARSARHPGRAWPGGWASLPSVHGVCSLEAELEGWVRRSADTHYEVLRAH